MVARLAAYLNIACFSGVCQGVEMLDKTEFQTLTRLLGPFEMTALCVNSVLNHFGWERVSIIWENASDKVWLFTKGALTETLPKRNITISQISMLQQNNNNKDMRQILMEHKGNSRIIVLCVMGETLRQLAVLINELQMDNGEYIFLVLKYYLQERVFGKFTWKRQNDTFNEQAKKAWQSMLFISYYTRKSSRYSQFVEDVRNMSLQYFNFTYRPGEMIPYPAVNLYEAVYLYAVAVNESLAAGHNISNGKQLSQRLWGRTFQSVSGGVTLNSNGDREQGYTISQLQTGDHDEAVANYFSHIGRYQMINGVKIIWPGGRANPPPDGPTCGYENEFCYEDEKRYFYVLVGSISGSLLIIILTASLTTIAVCRKLIWKRAVNEMRWKLSVNELKLMEKHYAGAQSTLLSRLTISTEPIEQAFIKRGTFKGTYVAIKNISDIKNCTVTRKLMEELLKLHDIAHQNICRFVGACVEPGNVSVVSEYCAKGSLQDVLENADIHLDLEFRYSLIDDILRGLLFLHESYFECHGNLKSSNCLVDGRFAVKLCDFAPADWLKSQRESKDLLWTAPEFLRSGNYTGSKEGDIYSLAIIIQEIIQRNGVFYIESDDPDFTSEEITEHVKKDRNFRPTLTDDQCTPLLCALVHLCWSEYPADRPTIKTVYRDIETALNRRGKSNILDNMIARMEQYAENLESIVEERTGKYLEEKKRAEDLLHRLLPESIAKQILENGYVAPSTFECVTIYFSDIVGFTKISSASSPMQIVGMLNDLYTVFDDITNKRDVYKVETIGDAYMVVSGLPELNEDRHASEIAILALNLLESVHKFQTIHMPELKLQLRIGIHSGPCVAGVVGLTMPRYCLFGDTVNTASRMESCGEALRIHISSSTRDLLCKIPGYVTERRGEIDVKGKGTMVTYWLTDGPTKNSSTRQTSSFI
ncbi:atrial natriuretic peptide receptor 1-like isoform X2 [Tubulanus polymorphus]